MTCVTADRGRVEDLSPGTPDNIIMSADSTGSGIHGVSRRYIRIYLPEWLCSRQRLEHVPLDITCTRICIDKYYYIV